MILVTSATGTVGREVVKQLKAQGKPVTAASRNAAKAQADLGVAAVTWNWDKPQDFGKALHGVDTLFLGTPPGILEEEEYGLAALEAAKRAGIKKIVKLSAIGVENMPDSPHRRVETAIEGSGLAWVFLRPSFFMQNFNEGMAAGIKASGAISVPAGDGRTGFIDARDIGAVAAVGLTGDKLDGQGLTLTGSEALTYSEIARQLGAATGLALRHDDLPAEDFKAGLIKAGMPGRYAAFMTNLYDQVVKKGYAATVTDAVKGATGRAPIQFAQYAKDYASEFKG